MFKDYYPKSQRSIVQKYIYPKEIKKMTFDAHLKNLTLIQKSQEKNKKNLYIEQLKEEQKQEEKLYKLKRFENIPSKLKIDTEEWVIRESEKRRPHIRVKGFLSPANNKNYISPYYDPEKVLGRQNNLSLFEQYYKEKLKALKKKEKKKMKIHSDSDILNNHDNLKPKNKYINNYNSTKNYNSINYENNDLFKPKDDLPIESGIILPKIKHNYLKSNIDIIKKIPKKYKIKSNDESLFIHKNYGKVPEYIKQFELEEIKRKEYEKLLEEEATYPPGTKLIPEEERIKTLNMLIKTKQIIENILEKMPITKRAKSIQDKKEDLERKLTQIEKEIQKFSKKRVFVEIEKK